MSGRAGVLSPIDPLRSTGGGRYADELVDVDWALPPPRWEREVPRAGRIHARRGDDGRILVTHRLRHAELDDDLGIALAEVLAPLTDDHEVFARAFTGVVLSSGSYAPDTWRGFYRNTLALLDRPVPPGGDEGYTGVYRHALDLLPTSSVVDLGCGFGFLALHLARRGTPVLACDIEPGTTALLRRMARRLRQDVRVLDVPEGGRVPLPDQSVDGVALLHVLEHVDAATGSALLAEATRLARRRVVVAVPLETSPTSLYGHLRSITLDQLRLLGSVDGWHADVHDHLGGWLVLDRSDTGAADHPTGWPSIDEGELQWPQ